MVPIPRRPHRFPTDTRFRCRRFTERSGARLFDLPNAEAIELRKLDSERLEEMFLSLQAGIRQGDPRSIEVGVRVLIHKADLNGYKAAEKIEMTGKQGGPLAIETFRKLCEEAEDEEVKDKDASDHTETH